MNNLESETEIYMSLYFNIHSCTTLKLQIMYQEMLKLKCSMKFLITQCTSILTPV